MWAPWPLLSPLLSCWSGQALINHQDAGRWMGQKKGTCSSLPTASERDSGQAEFSTFGR